MPGERRNRMIRLLKAGDLLRTKVESDGSQAVVYGLANRSYILLIHREDGEIVYQQFESSAVDMVMFTMTNVAPLSEWHSVDLEQLEKLAQEGQG